MDATRVKTLVERSGVLGSKEGGVQELDKQCMVMKVLSAHIEAKGEEFLTILQEAGVSEAFLAYLYAQSGVTEKNVINVQVNWQE